MHKIQFNTGRHYTIEGQVVVVESEGGVALFNDTSRMIWGRVDEVPFDMSDTALALFVMNRYDHGRYEYVAHDAAPKRDSSLRIVDMDTGIFNRR